MSREKKDGIKTNYYLDKDVVDALTEFCKRTARTKTKVVELAILEYLENHKEEK